ncbi:MAG TPA: lipid kinase [Gammaproteobacteria bacterium]
MGSSGEGRVKKSILVLINERSRRGEDFKGSDSIVKALRHGEKVPIAYYPESVDRMRELIERHHMEIEAILIGGGDGTLHAAIASLIKYGLPIGILPMGTANDLARTLGIPGDPEDAVRVILNGKLKAINLGIVNGEYFFNVANIGLGVRVAKRLSGSAKRKLGIFSYAKSLTDVFRRQRPFRVVIETDDRQLKLKSIQVAVGNGKFYGGGIAISEDADISENGLVLYSLEPKNIWQAAILGPLFKFGKIKGVNGITVLHSKKFRISTGRPMKISADGEIVSETPADFGFLPGALNVYVPEV